MKEECLICRAPLVYLEADEQMECEICHKKENSKTRCVHGHYVCNDCHTSGLDTIIGLCEAETAKDPIAIIEKMMHLPFCHMHGPEQVFRAVPAVFGAPAAPVSAPVCSSPSFPNPLP